MGAKSPSRGDPEQLSTALKLTRPFTWLIAAISTLLVGAFIAWGFFGQIDYRSEGRGVLLYSDASVYSVAAPGAGVVEEIAVSVGDEVEANALVAKISQSERATRIAASRRVVDQLETRISDLQASQAQLLKQRQDNADQRIMTLQQQVDDDAEHRDYLQALLTDQREDLAAGFVTRERVEETRRELHQTEQSIRQSRDQMAKIQLELLQFKASQQDQLASLTESLTREQNQIEELLAAVAAEQFVRAPAAGVVVAIAQKRGDRVNAGDQFAVIEGQDGQLQLVGYFPAGQGKNVTTGMSAQVSPENIERDVYGAMIGKVSFVSAFPATQPALLNRLGNEQLVNELTKAGAPLEVHIDLLPDKAAPSGLAWSSSFGPPTQITSGSLATAAVITRRASPIQLLIPTLRNWVSPHNGD